MKRSYTWTARCSLQGFNSLPAVRSCYSGYAAEPFSDNGAFSTGPTYMKLHKKSTSLNAPLSHTQMSQNGLTSQAPLMSRSMWAFSVAIIGFIMKMPCHWAILPLWFSPGPLHLFFLTIIEFGDLAYRITDYPVVGG